jgi:hypothetical protein
MDCEKPAKKPSKALAIEIGHLRTNVPHVVCTHEREIVSAEAKK